MGPLDIKARIVLPPFAGDGSLSLQDWLENVESIVDTYAGGLDLRLHSKLTRHLQGIQIDG